MPSLLHTLLLAAHVLGAAVVPANQVAGAISIAHLPKGGSPEHLAIRTDSASIDNELSANTRKCCRWIGSRFCVPEPCPARAEPLAIRTDSASIDNEHSANTRKCCRWIGSRFCVPEPCPARAERLAIRIDSESIGDERAYYQVGHGIPYPTSMNKDEATGNMTVYVNDQGQPDQSGTTRKCCRWIGSPFCKIETCRARADDTASGLEDESACCQWIVDFQVGEAVQFCKPSCGGKPSEPVTEDVTAVGTTLENFCPKDGPRPQCCQWVSSGFKAYCLCIPCRKGTSPVEESKRMVQSHGEDEFVDDKTIENNSEAMVVDESAEVNAESAKCRCPRICVPFYCWCPCKAKRGEDVVEDVPAADKTTDEKAVPVVSWSSEVTGGDESLEVFSELDSCPRRCRIVCHPHSCRCLCPINNDKTVDEKAVHAVSESGEVTGEDQSLEAISKPGFCSPWCHVVCNGSSCRCECGMAKRNKAESLSVDDNPINDKTADTITVDDNSINERDVVAKNSKFASEVDSHGDKCQPGCFRKCIPRQGCRCRCKGKRDEAEGVSVKDNPINGKTGKDSGEVIAGDESANAVPDNASGPPKCPSGLTRVCFPWPFCGCFDCKRSGAEAG